eukprot:c16576_g1_i2.p1 GENE.c16576_g1_i2~~c16576_g1_i2.p1  ORF type:complete len:663 (+),score=158.78 c16576_g1_i2:131-1990(+)
MSVIVRRQNGPITLLCKGADSTIMKLLKSSESITKATENHLSSFAREGLRTLCLAMAELEESEYEEWSKLYHTAEIAIKQREEKLARAADLIEKDLTLVGVSAIEDRLQDGVPETIATLLRANINIWMLTGDKEETAIEIARSCRLFRNTPITQITQNFVTTREDAEQALLRVLTAIDAAQSRISQHNESEIDRSKRSSVVPMPESAKSRMIERTTQETQFLSSGRASSSRISSVEQQKHEGGGGDGDEGEGEEGDGVDGGLQLVIDGQSLDWCLKDFPHLLRQIAPHARAVVVCRASPMQKANIVNLVKTGMDKITLAIGDGANDVPMIQAAHIGIGIAGEEGTQAVRSSDYSIGQFRFLSRLLLIHGRYFHEQISTLFLYSFYKNFVFAMCHFYLGIESVFSGQTFYNDMVVTVFNVFFANFPILLLGVWDRDLAPHTVMAHPEVYKRGQNNEAFSFQRYLSWIFVAFCHSLPVFLVPVLVLEVSPLPSGHLSGFWAVSFATTTCVVLVVNLKILLIGRLFTWYHAAAILFGLVSLFVITKSYEAYLHMTFPNDPLVGIISTMCAEPSFWLVIVIATVLSLLPDFIYRACNELYFPSSIDCLRRLERSKRWKRHTPS